MSDWIIEMARHYRIRELLTPDDLAALEAWVREANLTRTTDQCLEWVQSRGYVISRGAVWNWLDSFRLGEKTRRAAEISSAYLEAAARTDATAVASAALRKFQERILEFVIGADEADAADLAKLAQAMKAGMSTLELIETHRRQQAAAIAEAEKQAGAGGAAVDVIQTIKQALGLSAGADDVNANRG